MKYYHENMSLQECWDMVNAISDGRTPDEIRANALKADAWLRRNKNLTNEEWDELEAAVVWQYREAGRIER